MNKINQLRSRLDPANNHDKAAVLRTFHITMLLLAGIANGIFMLALAVGNYGMPMLISYFRLPKLIFLNLAPVVFLLFALYFIIGRAWISYLITSAITFTASFVNYFKLTFRNDPLYFEDLKLVTESVNITKNYNLNLAPRLAVFLVCIILGTAILWLVCPGKLKSLKIRAASLVTFLAIATVAFPKLYLSGSVYLSVSNNDLINIWSDTQKYISRGFVYPFLYSITQMSDPQPEGYSEDAAQAILDSYAHDDIENKASVICVMLEAFNDLTKFETLDINDEVYEVWHELEETGYSGNLVTNIFAGGTIDTERCFITGMSSLGSFRTPSWSYARYFSEQGYITEGMHPGYEWFYNRLNINENLGFDNYFFTENYFKDIFDNNVAPDSVLFPQIVERYRAREDGKPYFNFSVTYQNHGPYEVGRLYYGDNHILNDGITDESRDILNNYLGGIKDTQKEVKKMLQELNKEQEPIFVLLFGDHNPWLGDGNSVYHELGMNIEGRGDESFFNYYTTPYVIWANDSAKAQFGSDFTGKGEPISPCYLMNELFDVIGWGGPSYMKFMDEMQNVLPVTHISGQRVEDGNLTTTVSENAEKWLSDSRILRYYLRKDMIG